MTPDGEGRKKTTANKVLDSGRPLHLVDPRAKIETTETSNLTVFNFPFLSLRRPSDLERSTGLLILLFCNRKRHNVGSVGENV